MTALAGSASDAFWTTTLRRWNAVCWLLFAVMAVGLAAIDRPGGSKYAALVLLGAVMVSYAVLYRFPANPVVRPDVYLSVLVVALGGLAYLRGNYAALFMVTLPHYWLFGRTPRVSMVFLALATAATLAGSVLRDDGWTVEFFTETLVSTLLVVAVGALIGLWAHSVVAQSAERARLLAELEETQAELTEAHQRQGAADERERMARDIHDTLAQGFASIIVLAEAARAGLDADPARSAQQLRSIESTARENLAEARELVGSGRRPGQVAVGSVARTLRRTLDWRTWSATSRPGSHCCAAPRSPWPTSASTPAPPRSAWSWPGGRTEWSSKSPTTGRGSRWRSRRASVWTACASDWRNWAGG
jgi:signal transduction histidine kinase